MYDDLDLVSLLTPDVTSMVLKDRKRYNKVMVIIENFTRENKLFIGGVIGNDLILNKKYSPQNNTYDLYGVNVLMLARDLAKAIFDELETPYVYVLTKVPYREFHIFVDTRLMVRMYNLDKVKGVQLSSLLDPVMHTGYFTPEPLQCMSASNQLINIYQTLYSPNMASEWENTTELEEKLYNVFISEKEGGSEGKPRDKTAVEMQKKYVLALKDSHLKSRILVDDVAADLLLGRGFNPGARLQFITDQADDVKKIEHIVKSVEPKAQLWTDDHELNLFGDFRIRKTTIKVETPEYSVSLCDVFNSGTYELIPFIKVDGFRIGTPFVQLRFAFVNLWSMQTVLKMTGIKPQSREFIQGRVNSIRRKIADIHAVAIEGKYNFIPYENSDQYYGVYQDPDVAKKQFIFEQKKRFHPYYPMNVREAPIDQSV